MYIYPFNFGCISHLVRLHMSFINGICDASSKTAAICTCTWNSSSNVQIVLCSTTCGCGTNMHFFYIIPVALKLQVDPAERIYNRQHNCQQICCFHACEIVLMTTL